MAPKPKAKANQTKDAPYPVAEQQVAPVVQNPNVSAEVGRNLMEVSEEAFNMAENFIIAVHHQRAI